MPIRLSDAARRYIAQFEADTGATAVDCLPDEEVVTFLVAPDDMSQAIGPDGRTVTRLEERFGREVVLVEDAVTPEAFVANALAPAAVYDVTIEETAEGDVAIVAVDADDMGVAIGEGGHRIRRASRLVERHFDVERIELESRSPERRA